MDKYNRKPLSLILVAQTNTVYPGKHSDESVHFLPLERIAVCSPRKF